MRDVILADQWGAGGPLVTTQEIARVAERSTWTVRWWARTGQLSVCQALRSGQRLFRRSEVKAFLSRRQDAKFRGVRVLRPKKFNVPGEPQQLALFSRSPLRMAKARLRLVARSGEIAPGGVGTTRGIVRKRA